MLMALPMFCMADGFDLSTWGNSLPPAKSNTAWRTADEERELVYFALLTADIGTTLNGIKQPWFQEDNSLLGKHPTQLAIYTAWAASAATEYFGMRALPQEIRGIAQYSLIFVEGAAVKNNLGLGLQVRF